MHRRLALYALMATVMAGMAFDVAAQVGIGVFADQNYTTSGQGLPRVAVSGFNQGAARVVDVHIGFIAPDQTIYEFPDWNTQLRPWLRSFTLPAGFAFPATQFDMPQTLPIHDKPGVWFVAAALTEPGTMNLLAVDMVPFAVVAPKAGTGVRYGVLSLSIDQGAEGTSVQAGGMFYQANTDLTRLAQSLVGERPKLDQCVLNEIALNFSGDFAVQTLDAGPALSLLGNGEQNVPKMPSEVANQVIYGTKEGQLPVAFYQGGVNYRYQGPGGAQIAAFATTGLPAPAPLQLTAPSMSLQTHPTTQDLALTWQGQHGIGEVWASVTGTTLAKSYVINCRFVDDGAAVIPATLLGELKNKLASSGGGGISIPGLGQIQLPEGFAMPNANQVGLNIGRHRYTLFNTVNNDLDLGLFSIQAGANLSFRLE